MQFSICIPELCLVRFTVKDSDKGNTDLGQYSIPFLSMQHGKEVSEEISHICVSLKDIDIFDYLMDTIIQQQQRSLSM